MSDQREKPTRFDMPSFIRAGDGRLRLTTVRGRIETEQVETADSYRIKVRWIPDLE